MPPFAGNNSKIDPLISPMIHKASAAAPLPLINLGDHTLRMGNNNASGTRELRVTMYSNFVGYVELRALPAEAVGNATEIEMDGVTVVNEADSNRPYTIIGVPPDSQVTQNTSVNGLRVGYQQEWISDNLGLGGANFVGNGVYDWRWSLVSGRAPQQTSNATDGVWITISSTVTGFWRWDGTPDAGSFTSVFDIEIRDALNVTVATGRFTIERFTIP